MARQKLTPKQEDQIRSMRKSGKTPQECVDYMKATYGIDMVKSKISYIVGKGPGGYAAKKQSLGGGPAKRKYHKKAIQESIPEAEGSLEQDYMEAKKALETIFKGSTALVKHFKILALQWANKYIRVCKAAGIEIDDIKD